MLKLARRCKFIWHASSFRRNSNSKISRNFATSFRSWQPFHEFVGLSSGSALLIAPRWGRTLHKFLAVSWFVVRRDVGTFWIGEVWSRIKFIRNEKYKQESRAHLTWKLLLDQRYPLCTTEQVCTAPAYCSDAEVEKKNVKRERRTKYTWSL